MDRYCYCERPWLTGSFCWKCRTHIDPMKFLVQSGINVPNFSQEEVTSSSNKYDGYNAATAVMNYSKTFNKFGQILKNINLVCFIFCVLFVIFNSTINDYAYILIPALIVIFVFSYLQIAIVLGLSSYFQMRASDYLKDN